MLRGNLGLVLININILEILTKHTQIAHNTYTQGFTLETLKPRKPNNNGASLLLDYIIVNYSYNNDHNYISLCTFYQPTSHSSILDLFTSLCIYICKTIMIQWDKSICHGIDNVNNTFNLIIAIHNFLNS